MLFFRCEWRHYGSIQDESKKKEIPTVSTTEFECKAYMSMYNSKGRIAKCVVIVLSGALG